MENMNGSIVMVTGATGGIGEITAREIARMGATTVLVGRNEAKTQGVVETIRRETGNQDVDYLIADLSSMDEVRELAAAFTARYDRLHVLVNNAGMMFTSREITVDGYERTFALNHLSYFLLTNLLLDTLKATGTPDDPARVVNVSSDAHNMAKPDFENLQGEKRYSALGAYSLSKLENVMFTYELARRLEAEGAPVTANAVHPGMVNTGFGKNNSGVVGTISRVLMNTVFRPFQINAEKGAETTIYLATSPEVREFNGRYFYKNAPKDSSAASMNEADWMRLWDVSETLTGLRERASSDA